MSTLSYLTQSPRPLRFTSSPPCLRFGSQSQIFLRNKVRRIPVCRVSSKMVFPNLQADEFRHPDDLLGFQGHREQQNLALLEEGTKALVRGYLEVGYFPLDVIENGGTCVRAGLTQYSDAYSLMAETAEILNMTTPLLYIRNNDVPSARAVGLDTPYIVVHSCLLRLLTPQELQVVFAHELAHLKCGHYVMLRLIDKLLLAAESTPGFGILPWHELLRLGRAFDLTCDRASLLVVQDLKVVISAIMKLADGYGSEVTERDVDMYLAAAHAYVAACSSRDPFAREPGPLIRAYEVDIWSGSKEYTFLLACAKATESAGEK